MHRWLPILLLVACSPRPDAPPASGSGAPYVAGEERGYLEPCGCSRPQLGGLARKATALRGQPLLENGDLVVEPGRLNELKFETFMSALSEIGCRAVNIGEGDLELGLDYLRSAAGLARFPLISANVLDRDGRPVFPASADFVIDGSDYRAVGVLDPALAPKFRVGDPGEALRKVLADTPDAFAVILLYHGPREGAERLLAKFPRIRCAAWAHGDGEPVVHSERMVHPGDRSRWIIRLGETPAVVEMSEDIANDPRMERALKTYVRRLKEEDLLHRMNPGAPPQDGGYAGDEACSVCHRGPAGVHGKSRHANAIASLEKTGREVDPDCVGCHVIGYGEKTGFLSVPETPELARVGCENCHGPGNAHIAAPDSVRPSKDARKSCVECHTADTDPRFRFSSRWQRIKH